eukprot:1091572-Pleurochrysis_carterae.AAC.5
MACLRAARPRLPPDATRAAARRGTRRRAARAVAPTRRNRSGRRILQLWGSRRAPPRAAPRSTAARHVRDARRARAPSPPPRSRWGRADRDAAAVGVAAQTGSVRRHTPAPRQQRMRSRCSRSRARQSGAARRCMHLRGARGTWRSCTRACMSARSLPPRARPCAFDPRQRAQSRRAGRIWRALYLQRAKTSRWMGTLSTTRALLVHDGQGVAHAPCTVVLPGLGVSIRTRGSASEHQPALGCKHYIATCS